MASPRAFYTFRLRTWHVYGEIAGFPHIPFSSLGRILGSRPHLTKMLQEVRLDFPVRRMALVMPTIASCQEICTRSNEVRRAKQREWRAASPTEGRMSCSRTRVVSRASDITKKPFHPASTREANRHREIRPFRPAFGPGCFLLSGRRS